MDYVLNAADQLNEYDAYINDPRGTVATGFSEMDALLRKGGLASSTLVLLGGRTGTRKTTTTANMIANMLSNDIAVGLVGLDGSISNNYMSRLLSVWMGEPMENIEDRWNDPDMDEKKEQYRQWASKFSVYNGPLRPEMTDLDRWLIEAESPASGTVRPDVVFIDYVSLLVRNEYHGAENQRIHRLIENLQVFTRNQEVIMVALHQVGRLDEGVGLRYHGDTPMSLEGLKYGGEEIADIVFATYRPARDPVGNMSWEMARKFKGDRYSKDDWAAAVAHVEKYRDYTFLQLLKNRPGVHVEEKGIPLRSQGESMRMFTDMSVLAPEIGEIDPGDTLKAFGDEEEAVTKVEANKAEGDASNH